MSRNMKVEAMIETERNTPAQAAPIPSARFAISNLSVLAYAPGFRLWHYKAGKFGVNAVAADGFFFGASDMLAVGDMILVSAVDGGRMLAVARSDADMVTTAGLA